MTKIIEQSKVIYLSPELVENLTARLNRLGGHVGGVNRMLNDQKPCEDILVQLSAIKAALNQITIKLLQGHVEMCVTDYVQMEDMEALKRLNKALGLVLKNS